MADMEQIPFDFSVESAVLDSMRTLEDIMCSGHWSDRTLNYNDEHTILLLRLLDIGGVRVYKRGYSRQTDSPEIRRRAGDINMFMNKRYVGRTLLDIAGIFLEYEYDARRTIYNSLFFPELKAYVRCGGLPPNRLLEFFAQDGCDMVLLFHDEQSDEGYCFHVFTLAMPKELFLEDLDRMRERINSALHEAMRKMEEHDDRVIPPVIPWPDDE